jgi:hypothetical protein
MSISLKEICSARLPLDALPHLASLRCEPGLRAALTDGHVWLRWDAGNERVLEAVIPIHGVELFSFDSGRWLRAGQLLPAFDFPGNLDYRPLAHVLFPAPAQPIGLGAVAWKPLRLSLQRDDRPRAASALLCSMDALCEWSDTVPAARLASMQAAVLGVNVLVIGENLAALADGERCWGRSVLMPLGLAPMFALPESAIREAAGVQSDELLLWRQERAEAISRSMFAPLSRAGLRQRAREAAP